jgi:hypothetical protein
MYQPQGLTLTPPEPKRCPVQVIVKMYHEMLPNAPRIYKLTSARVSQIQSRWREDLIDLEDWRIFFEKVQASHFLTGRSQPTNGHKPFMADLEWLTKAANFAKVMEGKYGQAQTRR